MKYILHIDCSANVSIVALSGDGVLISSVNNNNPQSQAATINGMIDTVCKEASVALKDLSAIAVCSGPGSYTGLRIGLATAKGICYALGTPLLLHNKLELLASQQKEKNPSFDNYIILLTARDKEYFMSVYNADMSEVLAPAHMVEHEVQQQINDIKGSTHLAGDIKSVEVFGDNNKMIIAADIEIKNWAKLSYEACLAADFSILSSAEPFYMKEVFIQK